MLLLLEWVLFVYQRFANREKARLLIAEENKENVNTKLESTPLSPLEKPRVEEDHSSDSDNNDNIIGSSDRRSG